MAARTTRRSAAAKAKAEARRELAEMAREHTEAALAALVAVAEHGESEAARISAANAILDRGYGKPGQAVVHAGKDGGAIKVIIGDADAALL